MSASGGPDRRRTASLMARTRTRAPRFGPIYAHVFLVQSTTCYNGEVQNLTPRRWQSSIYYLLLFIAALTLLVLFMPEGSGPEKVGVTDFVTYAKQGQIDRVSQQDNTLTGYSGDTAKYTADYYGGTNDLISMMADGGVRSAKAESPSK